MKRVLILAQTVFCVLVFSVFAEARADEPTIKELMREIEFLKNRVSELESKSCTHDKKIEEQDSHLQEYDKHIFHKGGVREVFEEQGFRIGAGATFIAQGTPNANNAETRAASRLDGSYTVDLEFEKKFGDFGLGYLLMETGQGEGLNNDLSLFSSVNVDAGDTSATPVVTKVWYEQYLSNRQITLTGGKLGASDYLDKNEYSNDETSQFLSSMFKYSPAIDMPNDTGVGLRCNASPNAFDFIDLELLWMEEDADWEDMLDNPFLSAQINFMPAKAFSYDEDMFSGNYRAYLWYNGADHAELTDVENSENGNFGFGLSCDQKLGNVFGTFARFGWQNPKVSDIEYHWSGGARMTGEYWNRPEDIFAVAAGQAVPGAEYGDAGNPHASETHVETYYAFKLNDYLTLSPDLQIIWDPNGLTESEEGDNDTIFVYGLRGQVGF
ncbi:MAG: carbohydrate porin [Candidatus Omnitrophota bacterium]